MKPTMGVNRDEVENLLCILGHGKNQFAGGENVPAMPARD